MRARAVWAALSIPFFVGTIVFSVIEKDEVKNLWGLFWFEREWITNGCDQPTEPRDMRYYGANATDGGNQPFVGRCAEAT